MPPISEDAFLVLSFLGFLLLTIVLGAIAGGISWIGKQIEKKREEPRKLEDAKRKTFDAESKLVQKKIELLQLETGNTPDHDELEGRIQQAELEAQPTKQPDDGEVQPQR